MTDMNRAGTFQRWGAGSFFVKTQNTIALNIYHAKTLKLSDAMGDAVRPFLS